MDISIHCSLKSLLYMPALVVIFCVLGIVVTQYPRFYVFIREKDIPKFLFFIKLKNYQTLPRREPPTLGLKTNMLFNYSAESTNPMAYTIWKNRILLMLH